MGFVVLFTFLFDMLDLKPEAGSYLFIRSFSYLIYLAFRAALGLAAVFVLIQSGVSLPQFVMGLLGALSSLTIIQSFNFSVGGEKLATLDPLLARFRKDILSDNSARVAHQRGKRRYRQMDTLANVPEADLKLEFETLIAQLPFAGEELAKSLEAQLKNIPKNDKIRIQAAYARAIVQAANALERPGVLEAILEKYFPRRGLLARRKQLPPASNAPGEP